MHLRLSGPTFSSSTNPRPVSAHDKRLDPAHPISGSLYGQFVICLQQAVRFWPLRLPFRLNVFSALLDDKTESVPLPNHIRFAVDDVARPRDLQASALWENFVGTLCRPPGEFAFLSAIGKVGLPGYRHLLGDVPRLERSRIQTERLGELVHVTQHPTGFYAGIKCATDARLERGTIKPFRGYTSGWGRRTGPVVDKIAILPLFHPAILNLGQRLIDFGRIEVRVDHRHIGFATRLAWTQRGVSELVEYRRPGGSRAGRRNNPR